MSETTLDRFLGGRIAIRQPAHGFRAGLDAVMLAASVPAKSGEAILELGAGNGVGALCLAARVADCTVTGVEIDETLVSLANENAKANALEGRVQFAHGDALALPAWLRRQFTHVCCNPPFHREGEPPSPNAARLRATHDRDKLGKWVDAGLKRVAPKGTFTMIIRADRLKDLLTSAPERGVSVYPLWPHGVEPAKRVLVQVRKNSEAPSVILPGLVLHEDDGRYTKDADAILRGEVLNLSVR